MSLSTYTSGELVVGDVLINEDMAYGVKLVGYIYVEAISAYRWLFQDVKVTNNVVNPVGSGKQISITAESALVRSYERKWTKDTFTFKKGDVFLGDSGDYYLATTDQEVYSLKSGTWSSVAVVNGRGVWSQYSKNDKLTKVVRSNGDGYSSKFN